MTELRITHHFLVCTNRREDDSPLPCCAGRGSEDIAAAFRRELAERGYPAGVKVTTTGCLTPCQYGPNVVVYPEGLWYCGVTADDVKVLLTAHLDQGTVVERLRLPSEVRLS